MRVPSGDHDAFQPVSTSLIGGKRSELLALFADCWRSQLEKTSNVQRGSNGNLMMRVGFMVGDFDRCKPKNRPSAFAICQRAKRFPPGLTVIIVLNPFPLAKFRGETDQTEQLFPQGRSQF